MFERIGSRWWLMLLGAMCGLSIVGFSNYTAVPLYTGRTTLIEGENVSKAPGGATAHPQGRNLTKLLSSTAVMRGASKTLADLGLKLTPPEIIRATSVSAVRDTNIVAVEVTLPDQDEAKIAADVLSAEMKKAYADVYSSSHTSGASRPDLFLVTVDPTVVFPVDQHRILNLWGGLIGGLLLGAILAAMIPIYREGA